MPNQGNNGLDALIERILGDARKDAEATLSNAEREAQAVMERAERQADALKADYERKRIELASSILDRSRTNAQLEGRKAALERRRKLIDRAFTAAFEKLCSLTGQRRESLLRGLLIRESEGGETVRCAVRDRDVVTGLLPKINGELSKKGLKPLTLGENAAIAGGFILTADQYEKNCSFEAMLEDAKAACEGEVSGILFPEGL